VYLVGFIIRICHDARSPERKIRMDLKEICRRTMTGLIWLRTGTFFVCKPVRRTDEKCVGCHFLDGYSGCTVSSGRLL